jgi:hypothetical protein
VSGKVQSLKTVTKAQLIQCARPVQVDGGGASRGNDAGNGSREHQYSNGNGHITLFRFYLL